MKTFVLTDESLNDFGFWLPLAGAVLDQFEKNPLMLWMHHRPWRGTKDEILALGTWNNLRKDKSKGALMGDTNFDQNDDFAGQIESKVDNDIYRMVSLGIHVIETSTDPKWLKPGQLYETPIKYIVKEASICDMGSNPNALALAFYDENDNIIQLAEDGSNFPLKKLTNSKSVTPNSQKNMKKLALFFKLAEDSSEDLVLAAVQGLQEKLSLAETAKTTAETKLADYEKKEKDLKKAEAIVLLDAAVKDGRLNADGRKNWEILFEKDHDSAKVTLATIPARKSVKDQLKDGDGKSATERETLAKLSWDELDKSGKLRTLKDKYEDLYEEKFETKFHKKPDKK